MRTASSATAQQWPAAQAYPKQHPLLPLSPSQHQALALFTRRCDAAVPSSVSGALHLPAKALTGLTARKPVHPPEVNGRGREAQGPSGDGDRPAPLSTHSRGRRSRTCGFQLGRDALRLAGPVAGCLADRERRPPGRRRLGPDGLGPGGAGRSRPTAARSAPPATPPAPPPAALDGDCPGTSAAPRPAAPNHPRSPGPAVRGVPGRPGRSPALPASTRRPSRRCRPGQLAIRTRCGGRPSPGCWA